MVFCSLGIVIARAGSKGLPDKCVRDLCGRAVIEYTFDHARDSRRLTDIVFSTDSVPAKAFAVRRGIAVIDRPAELATDEATVDAVARHAVERWESQHQRTVDAVALLYGNIPIRPQGLIDRAIEHLQRLQADSVRSVAPVTKQHPDWIHRLDGDRMTQFRPNGIHRRQDLEPLYYHDGAVAVVTRKALFGALATPDNRQSFLGADRRAIVCCSEDAVDIDGPIDLCLAEAILRFRSSPDGAQPSTVAFGGRKIGPGDPVFIVAEAGVNHNGDVQTAYKLVNAAADAGADAVKFQMFSAANLASSAATTAEYQRSATHESAQREMLAPLELSLNEFRSIKTHCDERGVLFLVTPFGINEVRGVAALGVSAIKIASTDLTNMPLLEAAIATGLPLIVSSGAAEESEIESTVRSINAKGAGTRLVLLHCVSCYPAPLDSLNLRAIKTMAQRFSLPVGFSDHSTSTIAGAVAVAAGACVLEKHLTLDKTSPGPDHAMSLSPNEFKAYVAAAREAALSLGSGTLGMTDRECDVRRAARRSIVAAAPIPKGQQIAPAMLNLKRPGTGLPFADWERLVGRTASVDIAVDTLLSWDMVQ